MEVTARPRTLPGGARLLVVAHAAERTPEPAPRPRPVGRVDLIARPASPDPRGQIVDAGERRGRDPQANRALSVT